ncbi:MAG: YraN family protein [Betaproteobacteria bacterium]
MLGRLRKAIGRKNNTKKTGDDAERIAESYLVGKGLTVVARNYRCRFGEIDLLMQERETLVFVEVRMRRERQGEREGASGNNFGGAAASITGKKQARIIAAAQHYLAGMKHFPPCRFDAILMSSHDIAGIEWMRGAFEA